MSTLDIVFLIILGYGALKGFRKGFLMEIISILALIIGVIGAFQLMEAGMELLDQQFDINGTLLPYISFVGIFILIIIGVNFLGKSIKKVLDMTLLGSFDNLIGSVIGILKWAFGLSIIIWLFSSVNLYLPEDTTANSLFYPYIAAIAPVVIDWISTIFPVIQGLFDSVKEWLVPETVAPASEPAAV